MGSILAGPGARTGARVPVAPDPRDAIRQAGELLLLDLADRTTQAQKKAADEAAAAEAARQERAQVQERLNAIETQRAADILAHEERGRAHAQELSSLQANMAEVRTSAARLREELIARDAEAAELRAASARAAEEYARALEAARAATQAAEARAAAPRVVYEPAARPEKIDFEYHRGANGLLARVVLKAQGYEDVAIDIERGADNRMRNLKIGGKNK
jgi:chromosome segregation ATPase